MNVVGEFLYYYDTPKLKQTTLLNNDPFVSFFVFFSLNFLSIIRSCDPFINSFYEEGMKHL